MFKFLRSQAKVFYWVIAATFILFLILGGLTGRGCQAPGTRKLEAGVVGSVNGTEISAQQYDYAVRQQIAMMRQQSPDRDLNANQYAMARERAWDVLVQNALVEQAIKDRKIKVDDAEVLDAFRNNPPAELLAGYRDEAGQVDINRYYADLQNPDIDWSRAEEYIRTLIPRQKLNDAITAAATVTEEEVREEYLRQTGRAVAEYMGAVYADLDPGFMPADDAVAAYYQAHPDEFQSDAKAQCQVVKFAKQPSDADAEEIRRFIAEIREEINSGRKSFEQAAAEYSEDGSASMGGDLGIFDRNRMVAPFTEAAFALPVGVVSEPVKTQFGYHLIEVLDRETNAGSGEVVQVHARHILLKVKPGNETLDLLHEAATEFRARVDGNTFASTAQAEALEIVTPAAFPAGRDIPGLPMSLEASNWVFAAREGDISPVLENEEFFYVVAAGRQIPAGVSPLDQVKSSIMLTLTKEHNRELARQRLNPALAEVRQGTAMAQAAAKFGLVHAVTDTFTVNANIPDVGYGTDFNKTAINGSPGVLVPEVETLRGLYALVPLWISPFDENDFQQRRAGIMAALLNRAQGEALQQWLDEQTAAADIKDDRYQWQQGI